MVDAHFHCWERAAAKQAGILATPYLQRDFSFAELATAAGPDLEAAVAVQVNDFTDGILEARYMESVAAAEPRLQAFIAWAQLESEAVARELDALRAIPLVRGVRRTCQIEADPDFCARPGYVRGARALGERGLLCEICVRLGQVVAVPRLARAAPEAQFVLQHLGKPDLARAPEPAWLRALEELGRLPNVTGKLSVVVHGDADPAYRAEREAPFVTHVVDCLGWDRVMFGSNWPVATAVVGYREWAQMLAEILSGHGGGAQELDGVFSANAHALYRLA